MAIRNRGRPRKFAEFEAFFADLPAQMAKRPKYLKGIGVFRGKRGDTAWLKLTLPHGGKYGGKIFPRGSSVEIKVGHLSSWTWEQLVKKHTDLQGRADRGEPLEDEIPVSFAEYAESWLGRAKHRVRNFQTEEVNVRVHLMPRFGRKVLSDITPIDIDNWISNQLSRRRPGTVKRHLSTLKAILNDAVDNGVIDQNPCNKANVIKSDPGRQRFLEAEEIVRLLTAAESTAVWLRDAIVWALHSGMRRGEIQSMCWRDIREIPNGGKVIQIEKSKTNKARTVICTEGMLEVLERQSEFRWENDDRVFPVSAMTWRRRWEKARFEAGLSDIDFHDLRRTNATQAAVGGVDLRTLAARIGHSDLAMLEKHYAMVVNSAEREAAKKIQEAFKELTSSERTTGQGHEPED